MIVAIGAQNSYVLRQGLLRHHVTAVVMVCAVSDAVLIIAGTSGAGAVVDRAGWALDVLRWLGVGFLLWYAANSLRRAFGAESLTPDGPIAGHSESRRTVAVRAAALTWLNPHVYLDTVVLLGSVAVNHTGERSAGLDGRWWFAIGATSASLAWFSGLGFGARALGPSLLRPRAWQILKVLIAGTMVLVAAKLAVG